MIGACVPVIAGDGCTLCGACAEVCREEALTLGAAGEAGAMGIDEAACLGCGQCATVCPTGAVLQGTSGFRVQLAGKLGRHPRLARELPGLFSEDQACDIVQASIEM
jgi:dissimilatory sulfite reductase (desulfoviridin) alpha/beta subunit